MNKFVYSLIALFSLLFASPVFAHPGNTASDGCHYCRTNCDYWGVPWNARHCHNSKPVIPKVPEVKKSPITSVLPLNKSFVAKPITIQSYQIGSDRYFYVKNIDPAVCIWSSSASHYATGVDIEATSGAQGITNAVNYECSGDTMLSVFCMTKYGENFYSNKIAVKSACIK